MHVGASCLVVSGPFKGSRAVVKAVTPEALVVIDVEIFGRTTTITVRANDLRLDGTTAPSEQCPFQPADVVIVHDGDVCRGTATTLDTIDELTKRGFVGHDAIAFADMTLMLPVRRDPLPEYVAAIERCHHLFGYQEPLQSWCVEQLREVAWDPDAPRFSPDGVLAAEYQAFEQEAWTAYERGLAARRAQLLAQLTPLAIEDRPPVWLREWARYVGWREHLEATAHSPPAELGLGAPGASDKLHAIWKLRERFERCTWSGR